MEISNCINCLLNGSASDSDVSSSETNVTVQDHTQLLNFSYVSHADYDLDTRYFAYPGEFRDIPAWEKLLKILFYSLSILIALTGNIVVICVVWREKKLHSATYYYIVNLAVSDLLVTLSCSWVHLVDDLTEGWVLGAFFCRFNSFAQGTYSQLPRDHVNTGFCWTHVALARNIWLFQLTSTSCKKQQALSLNS